MNFKTYYYYSVNDPKKEAIDRVVAMDEEGALYFFAERKKMDEFAFIKLYNIEIDESPKSK